MLTLGCLSKRKRDLAEQEWNDFDEKPKDSFTIGNPIIINKSLYPKTNGYGTLSERSPACRLVTLTYCCRLIWGPHWWYIQKWMETYQKHYVEQYRLRFHTRPYEDPRVEHITDFMVPMEAAATFKVDRASKQKPNLSFRCVLTLAHDSLLRFVSSLTQRAPLASFTRSYRIYCMTDEEFPQLLPEPSMRIVKLTGMTTPQPLVTISGFCASLSEEQPHTTSEPESHWDDERSKWSMMINAPYDPTVLMDFAAGSDSRAFIPTVNTLVSPGSSSCVEDARVLVAPSRTITAQVSVDVNDASQLEDFEFLEYSDPGKWDVLTEAIAANPAEAQPWIELIHQGNLELQKSSIHQNNLKRKRTVDSARTSETVSTAHVEITAAEQRLQARDLYWDAIFDTQAPSSSIRLKACIKAPNDLPSLSLSLRELPTDAKDMSDLWESSKAD